MEDILYAKRFMILLLLSVNLMFSKEDKKDFKKAKINLVFQDSAACHRMSAGVC